MSATSRRPAEGLRTPAPAKINLTLEVLGKREDGYHELASVVETVDLADTVTITAAPERRIVFQDEAGEPAPTVFGDELIGRTWELLRERQGVDDHASVQVRKRIPPAGGLGGGSSDAAAFLRLARAWWKLALSDEELRCLASEIGSDVALFLTGGRVVVEGRGERVTPLPDADPARALAAILYTPELPLPANKTATLYGALRPSQYGDGGRTQALREKLAGGGEVGPEDVSNSFDSIANEVLIGVLQARRRLGRACKATPTLAGAGPSLFVLGEEAALAPSLAALRRGGDRAWLVRPLRREAATRVERVSVGAGEAE